MRKVTVGIIDYGAGNTESVRHIVSKLGYRSRLIDHPSEVSSDSVLLIPGVGAFPSAMNALHRLDLVEAIRKRAREGMGIIGVCLGMQLLAESSSEQGLTEGLGLLPGPVTALKEPAWHIGWNTLEVLDQDHWVMGSDGHDFYFNHAYEYSGPSDYVLAIARVGRPVPAILNRYNVYGFQFHPEKSQVSGLELMGQVITGLANA